MKEFKFLLFLLAIFIFSSSFTFSQSRWIKVYHDEIDAVGDMMIESYDHGYLLVGCHGHNYPKFLWLIKTDINGEILWEKTIGDGINSLVFLDMEQNPSGNIYLGGINTSYDSNGDPILMKLDSCGEQEWCRIFYTDNNMDYSSCMTLTQEGEPVVVLNLTNPDHNVERICLAKLSFSGELLWKQCYTSTDTSQIGELTYDIILTPDHGFLVTGFCYYEDPTQPNLWWLHPYFLKADSLGNFEWETVVYKETNLDGGIAWNTVVSRNLKCYYSTIGHYHHDTNLSSPALVKMDLLGNVIDVYDVVNGYKEGKLSYAQFLNDSILAAEAGWGNSDADLWSRAVIIDTLGNLLNSTVLMQDFYTSILQVAYDGKLVYASNTYQNNQFDFYLTKLNQNLEDDTLYTFPFTYDSLCPYQIVSDTIVQDDCELIVGIEEEEEQGGMEAWGQGGVEIWPNPCREMLNVECLMLNEGKECELVIYDIFGREVLAPYSPSPAVGEGKGGGWRVWQLDVSGLPPGVYFISITEDGRRVAGGKVVVAR